MTKKIKNNKIIYLGSSFPVNHTKKIWEFKEFKNYATKYRENYIFDSLRRCKNKAKVFVSTGYLSNSSFQATKSFVFKDYEYVMLGYFFRGYFRYISSFIYALNWILRNVKSGDIVVIYNFPPVFAYALILKKIFCNYKIIIQFEDFFEKKDLRFYFSYFSEYIGIKSNNFFLASSEGVKKYIRKINPNSTVLVNSGYEISIKNCFSKQAKTLPFQIFYSGRLDKERGVIKLIKMFRKLNHPYLKLFICGSGPLERLIKKSTDEDDRIFFVPNISDSEYIKALLNSEICINFQSVECTTNFPSKITGYLSAGKFILSTKNESLEMSPLNSLLIYFDEDDFEDFKKNINLVIKKITIEKNYEIKRKKEFSMIMKKQKNQLINFISLQ